MFNKNIPDNLSGQEIKEMIKNNKINFKDLDTRALQKLFDYETELIGTGEWDIELLNACAARLDELEGPVMSEEEFWAVIDKTKEKIFGRYKNETVSGPVLPAKRKLVLKKIWITAAAVVLLVAAATVTVSAFDLNIFQCFKEAIGLPAGEKINKDTITLVNNGKIEEHESIEKLLSATNLDILYPSVLPNGVELEKVHISDGTNSGEIIEFISNDLSICVCVDTNTKDDVVSDYTEQLVINGRTYYIFKGEMFAVSYYNNCYYYISSDSYENLILIINNMKETK